MYGKQLRRGKCNPCKGSNEHAERRRSGSPAARLARRAEALLAFAAVPFTQQVHAEPGTWAPAHTVPPGQPPPTPPRPGRPVLEPGRAGQPRVLPPTRPGAHSSGDAEIARPALALPASSSRPYPGRRGTAPRPAIAEWRGRGDRPREPDAGPGSPSRAPSRASWPRTSPLTGAGLWSLDVYLDGVSAQDVSPKRTRSGDHSRSLRRKKRNFEEEAAAGCSGTSPPAAGARAAETRAPRPPGGRAPPAAHPRARQPQGSLAGASRRAPRSQPRAGNSAGAPPTRGPPTPRLRRFRRAPPTRPPPTAGPASDTPPPRHCACAPVGGCVRGRSGARASSRGLGPEGRRRGAGRWRCGPRDPWLGLGPGACPGSPSEGVWRGGGAAGGGTTSEVAARISLSAPLAPKLLSLPGSGGAAPERTLRALGDPELRVPGAFEASPPCGRLYCPPRLNPRRARCSGGPAVKGDPVYQAAKDIGIRESARPS